MKTIDIDLTGVIYTAHLAYWAFAQKDTTNGPFSQESPRHHSLLLIGSMASLKYSTEPLYAAAKHGVLGLFRALRRPHYFTHTDRNNPKSASIKIKPGLLCPFFTETNIIKKDGVIALPSDVELTKIEEVVEAAGRIVLDKEGGKTIMVLTESMAKVMGRGRNKGGLVVVETLEGKL
jgi:NAD(P)-dependent dehydrogenase (short-subunit alcohol dehydrogenase family)